MKKKYYEVLGVPEDASEDEIKKAYRKAAREAHPDKEGGSTELMVLVNQAGETLKDRAKRAKYDQTGEDGKPEKSPDELAMEEACMCFSQVLERVPDEQDHIHAMVAVLTQTLVNLEAQIANIQISESALRKRRKYLRYRQKKSARNFLLDAIDQTLGGFPAQIAMRRERMKRIARARELMFDYGWEPNQP